MSPVVRPLRLQGTGAMLDPNAVPVGAVRVPGNVAIAYHLHDLAILADDVVRANAAGRILKPTDRSVYVRSTVGDVDHYAVDLRSLPLARNEAAGTKRVASG